MKKLTIIGASGHGKVVADIASLNGYEEIEFLDDDRSISLCGLYPVVGTCMKASEIENDIFIAIGNANHRKKLFRMNRDKYLPILVHPDAVVAKDAKIGAGTVIMAGAVLNPGIKTGEGCIINTCASVDHDSSIGNYVHVAVGAHLCGTVTVGDETWIGAGSIVSNNVSICGGCTIGAGAVVVKDIKEKGTHIGVPARMMNELQKLRGGVSCWIALYTRSSLYTDNSIQRHRRTA
ncbi:acetyltransferase [Sporofaciens musculi]|uniref:acetyltransferase n=1 Tax=Sporofaciens musculi TaxID=2681861 RepID=UPI00259C98C0|nr:acetyltransferase [Sporofaciens musculi]